jgi:hypothetical protein
MRFRLRTLMTPTCLLLAAIAVIAGGAAYESTPGVVLGVAVLMAAGVSLKRSLAN